MIYSVTLHRLSILEAKPPCVCVCVCCTGAKCRELKDGPRRETLEPKWSCKQDLGVPPMEAHERVDEEGGIVALMEDSRQLIFPDCPFFPQH